LQGGGSGDVDVAGRDAHERVDARRQVEHVRHVLLLVQVAILLLPQSGHRRVGLRDVGADA
jgi:hypothetical protein